MIKLFEAAGNLITTLELSTTLTGQLAKFLEALKLLRRTSNLPEASYENLLLDLVLDINDPDGRLAVLRRKQRVRFLTEESGVIRNLVWGEGNAIAGYRVSGARRLAVRQEGSKRVVLLGVAGACAKGDRATVKSRRVIRGGFMEPSGYFETMLERPTRRVAVKVMFPRSRPPKESHLMTSPPTQRARRLPLRYGADGRPFLTWSRTMPDAYRTYSMRWSW